MGPEAAREFEKFLAAKGLCFNRAGSIVPMENQAMSDVINPEDVTNDIFKEMNSLLSDQYILKHQIAAILNAAIEAGLVSPPVWAVIADEDSPDFKNAEGPINPVYLTTTKQEAEFRIREDILDVKKTRVEHWKGQTE